MEPVLVVLILAIGALVLLSSVSRRTQQRQVEQRRNRELEQVRSVAEEDTTRFGEELADLHTETLTDTLDAPARQDYQRALDSYENAKSLLADARTPDDVQQATSTLEDGRYAMSCVLARVNGEALPQRRPPCFFNPRHGPAQTDVLWAPAGGERREIPVCLADADRLEHGAEPDTRTVRSGNRMVPWYQGGPAYSPYAGGYYGGYAMNGLFPGFILGSMMAGGWGGDAGGLSDGAGDMGGDMGGDAGGGDMGGDGFGWGDMGGGGFDGFGF